ncbi:MAG: alanine racemase [Bacteroidota bacterium]
MKRITRPTLLINEEKCLQNIHAIATKAKSANCTLRPHFKTHHSSQIANWYRQFGVEKCTVSSVEMATYFADHGWNDITIAFPFNPLEHRMINDLAKRVQLNILLESLEAMEAAQQLLKQKVGFFIKLDMGMHRTGLAPTNLKLIADLIAASNERIEYQGFVAHLGHTYGARGAGEIMQLAKVGLPILESLRDRFGGIISYGDTPSCSCMNDFNQLDEIRAGNYIFYDIMQSQIGSCSVENIAVCMACPVVAKHEERDELVIHGGAVHFSKDSISVDGTTNFGRVVRLGNAGWDTESIGSVVRLSQEHGIINASKEVMKTLKIGDLVGVLPVHSCLTADLQGHYMTTSGQRIEKMQKG